jgi:DNA-directed RNA polymerase subunit alpha
MVCAVLRAPQAPSQVLCPTTNGRALSSARASLRPMPGSQVSRKEFGVPALAMTKVSVREVLQEATFGPEQIKQIAQAVAGTQAAEVRSELQLVEGRADAEKSPGGQTLRAGVVNYLLGQVQRAEQYLTRLSGNGLAEFYLGQLLVGQGRAADAEKKFDDAEKHGHDPIDCRLAKAGAVRMQGRLDEAEKVVRSSAPQGATRADYSYQMGCILSDRGDTYGAVEYFERAVDMDPYHTRALFWLAGENYLRGNDQEAIAYYERSLSRPPLHLSALLNLGLLYEENDNPNAAAYCFRRVLDVYPGHERARLYLKDIEPAADMFLDEDSLRNQAKLSQLLLTPITDFELSVRARNCLQKIGIRTLQDLTQVTEAELLQSKNFGETSLQEIKQLLEAHGLKLGQPLPKDRTRDYGSRIEALTPQEQALMAKPVSELNLSVRARKCMTRLGINSIGELVHRTPDELLESKNFGVTSLNEVRQKLADLGLKLRND